MMIHLPQAQDLLKVALRCVWFQTPVETLNEPISFFAHVFTYGTHDDITVLRQYVDTPALAHALENAPPGIIDARSWAYWNLILRDLSPPPPMPTRTFPEETHI